MMTNVALMKIVYSIRMVDLNVETHVMAERFAVEMLNVQLAITRLYVVANQALLVMLN